MGTSTVLISHSEAASPPSNPQYVEAMAGNNEVAVTWEVPSSSGGETLNYTARVWTLPPPTNTPAFGSCTTSGLGCVIGGLVSGATYYVDVIATNSAGASGPSASKSISPGSAGSPPTNVSAKNDGTGKITISWTPPTNLGKGQFAWYTAEVFTNPDISAGAYKFYCTADPASATSCFVVGTKAATTYYVQVRTVSSLGSSYPTWPRFALSATTTATPTTSSKPSTTVKLPVPQNVKAVLQGKSIKVSWKAPVFVSGKLVTGYTVTENYLTGKLITTCKTKVKILTCLLPIRDAKTSVSVQVFAVYGSGVLAGSKILTVKVPY